MWVLGVGAESGSVSGSGSGQGCGCGSPWSLGGVKKRRKNANCKANKMKLK